MDYKYEQKYHHIEAQYWWFVGRRDIICNLLRKYKKNIAILDLGCSAGALIDDLKKCGFQNVYGVDISVDAINKCKTKGHNNVDVMDGADLKYNDGKFDIIIASDIIEHIENDHATLINWKRKLKKGGKLIVFVPAFQFLWSDHDELNHHFRRYNKKKLNQLLVQTDFTINRISYWNFNLFFPASIYILLKKILKDNKTKQRSHLVHVTPFINDLFIYLLKFENFLLRGINLPVGMSIFAIVKK